MSSTYIMSFDSDFIPFGNPVIVALSNMHQIKGDCFVTHKSTWIKGTWRCSVTNTTRLQLEYDGDNSLMMIDNF